MKLIYSLFCFCLSFTPLLAYPVDYNETSAAITREALTSLITLINDNTFPARLQKYYNDINDINSRTYGKIKTNVDSFSQRLAQVEDSAANAQADIAECLENLNLLTAIIFYQTYTEDCVNPSRALGSSVTNLGYNKQTQVFFSKYQELMNFFNGCLHGGDPAPHICAGVVESTLQEVNRILPAVKANPLQVQRELQKQIVFLAECAYQHVSAANKRLEVEFGTVKTCIVDKINI